MELANRMKILFLDLDGVLDGGWSKYNLDPNKITKLEEIIKATNAKIVVSSSWSVGCKDGKDFVEKIFGAWSRLTGKANKNSIFIESIIDVTDHMGRERGDEIQRWLDAHEDEVENYLILDDDMDMLDEQLLNFVQTDGFYGISDRTVDLAIKVLNGVKIEQPQRLNMALMLKRYDRNAGRESNINDLLDEYHKRFK